jgi:hypothetical protein
MTHPGLDQAQGFQLCRCLENLLSRILDGLTVLQQAGEERSPSWL